MILPMLRTLCLVGVLMTALSLDAAIPMKLPRLKVGNETYTNITVTGVNATDLFFSYPGGAKNVKLRALEPEIQKLFDFDPTAATQAERQRAENESRYENAVASKSITLAGSVPSAKNTSTNETGRTSSEDNMADSIS